MSDIPVSFNVYNLKSSIDVDAIDNGTNWFCLEDESFGIKIYDQLYNMGNNIKLVNGITSTITNLLNYIIVTNSKSDINLNDIDESLNILYLCKNDKKIILVMNKQIVFEMTGS